MNSIWNLRYHVAIFTLLFASIYIFWQLQKIDLLSSADVVEFVSELKQVDQTLNEEILEIRYFRRDNYNYMTKMVSELEEFPNRVKRSNIQRFLQDKIAFQQNFIQLETTLRKKLALVQNFKNLHGTLHRSLESFPKMVQKHMQEQPSAENELYFLLLKSFVHNFTNSEGAKADVERIVAYANKNNCKPIATMLKSIDQQRQDLDKTLSAILQSPTTTNLNNFFQQYKEYHHEQLRQFSYHKSALIIAFVLFIITLFLLLYSWQNKTQSTKPLTKICQELYDEVGNVGQTSDRLKKTSEWITTNGKQQNSAIQNTNILLREMTQVAQIHWQECAKAQEITDKADSSIRDSINHSHKMILAIKEMEAASYEASTILQNIQEIAKQSKIVGLNATIEAAKSDNEVFELVAQEVSSLAIRSAEALEETSSQILNSQERSRQGTNLTENILLYLSDTQFKIQSLEEKIDKMNAYFQKQKSSFETFGHAVDFVTTSIKKNDEFSQENAQLAENLHSLSSKLKKSVNTMLSISKEMAMKK
ncbi:DAHL domain-containing protein [Candidatus Uabimicrobium amorphum]|uniref:Methyl-accepting chemotaxis protein n=1 Tax=Uabimicrobium amorphum TaxID=2596890 RepID=A0A5S9F377_UABAM|nr:DAHL domain-containing protein [Candidatus Uabimicrobium amorphum]BBM82872.1 methyl-accepting chemotaxis protein [Candidatus Uabimicrobium amorphum]